MIVCLCKAVSDRVIREALGEGHTTFKQLTRRCGAGTGAGCGGCHASIKQMIAGHDAPAAAANSEDAAAETPFVLASCTPTG